MALFTECYYTTGHARRAAPGCGSDLGARSGRMTMPASTSRASWRAAWLDIGLGLASGLAVVGLLAGLWWLGRRATAPLPTLLPTVPPASTPTAPPAATPTAPPPSATPAPTPSASPTLTPSPTATLPPIPDRGSLVIGTSVEGRPLTVYRFGHGPHQRMVVAGIHGGYEWNTVALAEALLDALRQGRITVPPEVTLFVLPNLNPDGYERQKGVLGRANAHGVDLNRNFDWNWAPDWDRRGCWAYAPITAGPAPFSEPETQALRDFLSRPDVHLEALVSYHSAALGVFPAGWPDAPGPRSTRLAQAIAQVTGYRYPPADGGCQLTGQLVDWVAFTFDTPAVDVELSTHQDLDLPQNLAALRLLLSWELPAATASATATPTPRR